MCDYHYRMSIIMIDYREILRLKSLNYSNVNIASCVHSSRNTVREVLSIAQTLQIRWPLADDVTNQTLQSLFYTERTRKDEDRLIPEFPKIHRELAGKGVSLTLLCAVLSCSLYAYAEDCANMKEDASLNCHIHVVPGGSPKRPSCSI